MKITKKELQEMIDEIVNNIISEKLTKTRVIRNNKKAIKWKTDKEGYKVDMSSGRPKEVKMKASEKVTRKKASRKAAIKSKSKKSRANTKRARSMSKRND